MEIAIFETAKENNEAFAYLEYTSEPNRDQYLQYNIYIGKTHHFLRKIVISYSHHQIYTASQIIVNSILIHILSPISYSDKRIYNLRKYTHLAIILETNYIP